MIRYGFNIRTRTGQRVDNISIISGNQADAERRLPRRYVLTRFDARRKMSSEVADLMALAFRPDEICATRIAENVSLAESPARHLDIFRHAPQSRGAREYQELVDELVSAGFIA